LQGIDGPYIAFVASVKLESAWTAISQQNAADEQQQQHSQNGAVKSQELDV
jgi:hypothetical protein